MELRILNIHDACTGCGACVNICPKQCLELGTDQDGFFYPRYNPTACIECHLCEKTCHAIAQVSHNSPSPDSFYLYYSKDSELRQNSSSGGAFSLLAQWVLDQGGVVFGSKYNADTERLEVSNTENTSLESLRKSKYVESFTGSAFADVKQFLKCGRYVLYCGTPCQVRGLRNYLNESRVNQDKFLAVDFACHGVPSNDMFRQFVEMIKKPGEKVVEVDYRHKDFSKTHMRWHNMTMRIGFSSGRVKVYPRRDYYYYYYEPFYNNLTLRPCCYHCDIASHSDADITLGDFWGIAKHRKQLDDDKGTSFVCINNQDYLPLWNELSIQGYVEKLPFEAIEYQYRDNRPKREGQVAKRDAFLAVAREKGWKKAVEQHYGKTSMMIMFVKYKIRYWLENNLHSKK